jgi:hypothetical protein
LIVIKSFVQNKGHRACLKTAVPIKIRHSRESGNPVFSIGSGFGACPVLDTGVKSEDDKTLVFRQAPNPIFLDIKAVIPQNPFVPSIARAVAVGFLHHVVRRGYNREMVFRQFKH